MKKVVLIDGNNLLFRSYYATVYSGSMMKNFEGFPTNALYGFTSMINKIISEEKPEYMMVAFDIGKTFRHDSYEGYKATRSEMPDDLSRQFPVAKELLQYMGIKYVECTGYEADDIIGTYAKIIDNTEGYEGLIVSSDRDLLQLISNKVNVKLLKQSGHIMMNKEVFMETYGIEPLRIIDLKGIEGDTSDNIPGIKGIGAKGALKLLQEYDSLENIYVNIDNISGATKTKLIDGKEKAFMSKSLATIYRDINNMPTIDEIIVSKGNNSKLMELYKKLEFYSLLKDTTIEEVDNNIAFTIVNNINDINIDSDVAIYLELSENNYHNATIIGMGVYNDKNSLYIPYNILKNNPDFLTKVKLYTYDIKKVFVSLNKHNIKIDNLDFDLMIASYLLGFNVKDDISYLANSFNVYIPIISKKNTLLDNDIASAAVKKAKFIYDNISKFNDLMNKEDVLELYESIEFPLALVLARMEIEGIRLDKNILEDMKKEIEIKMELLSMEIFNLAGQTFNISSPKQLGEILFEKLNLPFAKKNKTGYNTDVTVLNKLKSKHPIIDKILEYRMISKLYSTYIEGLLNATSNDGKIHTIFTQTLTRTGRLSSIEPNLQNIPIRYDYGRMIRKAFVPEKNSILMSSDYSQIELRIFSHMAGVKELIDAFKNDLDIHTKTAADILDIDISLVNKDMRRKAKAVNFGILYGISSYGLAEDLGISPSEAKHFIEQYFETYPGVKKYMDTVIEEAHKNGYVKTLLNRKRVIDELNNKNYMIRSMGERMALNTPVQGTNADILKMAMIKIDKEIINNNLKSRMLLQVHDELIFNCLNEEKEIITNIVKDCMENIYKLDVPLKVDIEYGNNWYEAK